VLAACFPLAYFAHWLWDPFGGAGQGVYMDRTPWQDAKEARRVLVGKWERDWGGVAKGYEFFESGKAVVYTHRDGEPVRLSGNWKVPQDTWLVVTIIDEDGKGHETSYYRFTVTQDETRFYKGEGKKDGTKGGMRGWRKVKTFSAKVTGE
jgi:hypothetical protein